MVPRGRTAIPNQTCGNEKGDWFDEACHVEPAPEESCQGRFSFASDGRVRGDGTPEAERMIEVLKLNHPELIAERSSLIEELDTEVSHGSTASELRQSFDDVGPAGTRVSFANVAVRYLKDR